MNTNSQNPNSNSAASRTAIFTGEETLRLIAGLPAPEGLEERVHATLRSPGHRGRLLAWPALLRPGSDWMRAAAAAAIAFVIAGGGWGVYLRVEQGQAKLVAMPPHIAAPGSFAGAGAMRTPQTLNGPVLVHPLHADSVDALAAEGKIAKKAPAHSAPATVRGGQNSPALPVIAHSAASVSR